jgi:hypothetical protein
VQMIRKRNSRWRAICRKRGLASQAIQREQRASRPIDADTLRCRALHDARGQVVREGATYRASGVTHWQVRRAVDGRCDQWEFVANGRVKLCAGPMKFPKEFRP